MKYVIALLMLTATLVAWSPNTNPYAVEKTKITEELAQKLGLIIGDEVSYLQMTKEGLVRVKIDKKRINLVNAKPEDMRPDIQPVLVTSKYKNFKTGYCNNVIPPHKNWRDARSYIIEDSFDQLVCFYLDYEGRHIEFWYLRDRMEMLSDLEVDENIKQYEIKSLKITPNPANSNFVLQIDTQNIYHVDIEIYDTNRNLVKQITDTQLSSNYSTTCDVSDLPVGMYSVICFYEGQIRGTDKLIVMR